MTDSWRGQEKGAGYPAYLLQIVLSFMQNSEIEIQVQLDDEAPLRSFLEIHGRFVGELHQVDEYFTPPHKDFLSVRPVCEWLRLRESGGEAKVTYKRAHFEKDGSSDYRDEYETGIESSTTLRAVFMALQFRSLVTVEKRRLVYMYNDFEIVFDDVKGLGKFVEVEYKGTAPVEHPKQITDKMIDFLKTAGCGRIIRNYQGYPFLLLFPKEVVNEIIA